MRIKIAAILRDIVASCYAFLWIGALRGTAAVIDFAFVIFGPVTAMPSADQPAKAGLTSRLDDELAVPAGINMANGRK